MKRCHLPPQLVIPTTFENCLTYEKQILFLCKTINTLSDQIDELEERVQNLENPVDTTTE